MHAALLKKSPLGDISWWALFIKLSYLVSFVPHPGRSKAICKAWLSAWILAGDNEPT